MPKSKSSMLVARIEARILLIRGQKVLLDEDLAEMYEVDVKVLNQAVKRNQKRFPGDFLFQLSAGEPDSLRSQFVTLDALPRCQAAHHDGTTMTGRGQHRKYRPWAFTEQGVAMLSGVLRSGRAVQVNIEITQNWK